MNEQSLRKIAGSILLVAVGALTVTLGVAFVVPGVVETGLVLAFIGTFLATALLPTL